MDEERCGAYQGKRQSEARTDARCPDDLHEAEKDEKHKRQIEKHEDLDSARDSEKVPLAPVRRVDLVSHQKCHGMWLSPVAPTTAPPVSDAKPATARGRSISTPCRSAAARKRRPLQRLVGRRAKTVVGFRLTVRNLRKSGLEALLAA